MTPKEMKAELVAKVKPGSRVQFPNGKSIWIVESVVVRGAVVYKSGTDSHKHLAEWAALASATIDGEKP